MNQVLTQVEKASSMSSPTDSPMVLESWKDIAAYFNRSARTVQRWEVFEGMPVHRHRHASGCSLFAYERELDAWRASRSRQGRAVSTVPVHSATIPAFQLEHQAALRVILKEILRQLGETRVRSTATPPRDTTPETRKTTREIAGD
jgi:hypothetical protein